MVRGLANRHATEHGRHYRPQLEGHTSDLLFCVHQLLNDLGQLPSLSALVFLSVK